MVPGRFENKELECLFRRYILRLQHASITAAVALFVVLTAALATASFVVVQVGFAAKFVKDLFRVLLNCVPPNSVCRNFRLLLNILGDFKGSCHENFQNYAKVVYFSKFKFTKKIRKCVDPDSLNPDRAFQVNPDPDPSLKKCSSKKLNFFDQKLLFTYP
jgi:hypothetical protein